MNDNTKQGFGRVSQKSNEVSSKPSHETPRRDSAHAHPLFLSQWFTHQPDKWKRF